MVKQLIRDIENLMEQYAQRIQTATDMIEKASHLGHHTSEARVTAKKSCYTYTYEELRRVLRPYKRLLAKERCNEITEELNAIVRQKSETPKDDLFGKDLHGELDAKWNELKEEKNGLEEFLTFQ